MFKFFKRKKSDYSEVNTDEYDFKEDIRPTFQPSLEPFDVKNKDFEIIIAKLDLINSKLINIERRIEEIERIAKESQQPKRW